MRMNKAETKRFFQTVRALSGVAVRQDADIDDYDVIKDVERLYSIERQLASIDERVCSIPMTERQAKWNEHREKSLKDEASIIALKYKCFFYHQPDHRGAQVYLIPHDVAYEGGSGQNA